MRTGVNFGFEIKVAVNARRGSKDSSSLFDKEMIRPRLLPSSSSTAMIYERNKKVFVRL
jgi:hypothetical protein